MAIGNWGKVISFETSADKTLTFSKFKREVSGRWKKHNIIGKKPKGEFAGPDSSRVTMEVVLSAERGIRPRKTIEKIEKAVEKGQVEYLYVGGKKVGSRKMALESASETWDEVWNAGELVKATLALTFSEY